MLAYIKGTVAAINETSVVVDCNNIGYEITASARCLSGLTVGEEVKLQTLLIVREDNISLYGFADTTEKEMFSRLTTVSGVGPKLAVSVLGGIDARALINCIASQDVTALSNIKGIGKKTAERILLELKGKIKADTAVITGESGSVSAPTVDDAVLALMSLGYSSAEAVTALAKVDGKEKMSLEEIIMAALRG